ncbi:hypothetical protein JV228_001527 [Shigella flexneri]|nr:hypothetical protein [Salmonella enterica]EHB7391011.1 hypothetical protein [Shigella flexneri]EHR6921700.1 hypothetical protein [Escherichia coli]EHV1159832.1 hypothetical protein [Shigella flexneri]
MNMPQNAACIILLPVWLSIILLSFNPVRVYCQFTELRPCPVTFRFSDQLFSDDNFTNWLFFLISCSPSMPLQDAGQLLPATRSQL